MKKKIILIVLDGLADEKIPQLKNKTPLEAADTPNLNFFSKFGMLGSALAWQKRGHLPTSEETHLAIFGYHPERENPNRGVLEALGAKIKIKKDNICFRGNFATVDFKGRIVDRRAQRIEKTEKLISALNKIKIKGAKILVKKSFGHRFVFVLSGNCLSEKVTSNDPKKIGVFPEKFRAQKKEAKKTAVILQEFVEKSRAVLENHPENKKRILQGLLPANYLLLRGAGKYKKVKTFSEKYFLKAGFVAGGTLYKGIGRFLGMKEIEVKGANGMPNTNLRGKVMAIVKNLKRFNFLFLHIKATDTFAEDGNFFSKKEFIEKVDKNLKPLLNLKNVLICVTGDHPTSSLKKSHIAGENPVLIFGTKNFDKIEKFSEENAKKGSLGKFPQLNLMKKILGLLDAQ
jgi:2,3-bisphosphoglycerate-independent phosphoglycerate mutase